MGQTEASSGPSVSLSGPILSPEPPQIRKVEVSEPDLVLSFDKYNCLIKTSNLMAKPTYM